jgi:hypothetical protein
MVEPKHLGRTRPRTSFPVAKLICPSFDLSKGALFSRRKTTSSFTSRLLTVAEKFGWQLVFSNHYHFIAHSPADADDVSVLHFKMAEWVNKLDKSPG